MPSPTPTDLLRQALTATQAGDRPKARALLQEATKLEPRNEAAWRWLAGLADSPVDAVAALERVVALNPNNDKAKAALRETRLSGGIAAAKAKDIPTARRLLRAAVADDPNSEQGWFWLAAVCDSPTEAISYLQRVLTLNPNHSAAKKGVEYYQAKLKKSGGVTSAVSTSGVMQALDAARPSDGAGSGVGSSLRFGSGQQPTRRLLVVDESRTNRKLIAMTAAADGMKVAEAADATEAAHRILEDGPPDLIVVDAALPGTDGYEFCKMIRANPTTKQVPVVLMAGRDGLRDKIRGAVAGVSASVAKPIDPDELMGAVRSCLTAEPAPTA
jgi:twitching motility two-component system response regulator PilG